MRKEIKEILILSSILVVIFLGSFLVMATHEDNIVDKNQDVLNEQKNQSGEDTNVPTEEEVPEEPISVDSFTGLLIGTNSGLTDVIMVGHFDATTNEVKIVSVPRDLHIDFREGPFKAIKDDINKDGSVLKVAYCKLGETYINLGASKEHLYDVQTIVEEITGLQIDYMAVIDVSGFADVIDVIGGVDFDVPQRMYYTDKAQDLYIDLQKGPQHLDGEHAMQLVRFRKYVYGDLQRIQVQHDFIVELYKKISAIRSLDQIVDLTTSVYNIFESDFGLTFGLDYAKYLFEIETENLLNTENMVTIPSWGELIDEKWYQKWDAQEARKIVQELMDK